MEDFQVILSPNGNSETGDGNIKIQYKEFNNTSNGYYPEGGTPTHGCYATIGIENKFGNEGLEYTFDNVYHETSMALGDGTAILITTEVPFTYILGDTNLDGILNVLDIVLIVNYILGNTDFTNEQQIIADINEDGTQNILDVVLLVNIILGG